MISISYTLKSKAVGRQIKAEQLHSFIINLMRVGATAVCITIPGDLPLATRLHIKKLCQSFSLDVVEEVRNEPIRA